MIDLKMNVCLITFLSLFTQALSTSVEKKFKIYYNTDYSYPLAVWTGSDYPTNIDYLTCLIECLNKQTCLTARFKTNPDQTNTCILLYQPHNLTNAIVTALNTTLYNKIRKI